MRRVMIVGGTDGIGLALVRYYSGKGFRVAVLGRSLDKLKDIALDDVEPLMAIHCDLTVADQIGPAFQLALERLGHADIIIYCAGVMVEQAETDLNPEADAKMFTVNTLAGIRVLALGANYLMQTGQGQLAAISSVAGDRGRKANPGYGASKAALDTYLEGLRNRLYPLGVAVSTIKPGFVNTRMTQGKKGLFWLIEPSEAARLIALGLERRCDIVYCPPRWAWVMRIIRWTPSFLFKRFGPA